MPRTPNRICEWCSVEFYRSPCQVTAGYGRWCSPTCMKQSGWIERQREKNKDREGKKNPNYKHGKKVGKQIRTTEGPWAISTKGGPCRSCGSPSQELHHAIPRSKSRVARADLRNGLPLCHRCHCRWHAGHPIRREVFTEEEWSYLVTVDIPGWETEAWLEKHYPSAASIAANALVAA